MAKTLLRSLALLLIPLAWPAVASTQSALLVHDINQDPVSNPSSLPLHGFLLGGSAYFFAKTSVTGRELYRTDGTAAGTVLVENHFPRDAGWSVSGPPEGPVFTTSSRAFWFHIDLANGTLELWSSDCTPGGAVRAFSVPRVTQTDWSGAVLGDRFVFTFDDAASGRELWVSDGTVAGTTRLTDANGAQHGVRGRIVVHGAWAYFVVVDGSVGTQLWQTDGISAALVFDDPSPGAQSSEMVLLAAAGNQLFFAADDATYGRELWRTDGTAAGTLLLDVMPGAAGIAPDGRAIGSQGTLLFAATDPALGLELWSSDGTVAGTAVLRDINPGAAGSNPESFVECNGVVLFHALSAATGREPWVTDRTAGGTQVLLDVHPGPDGSVFLRDLRWFTNGNIASITTQGRVVGQEPLVTDGTPAGTFVVDLDPGASSSSSDPVGVLSATELLIAGSTRLRQNREPWRTDGTVAGTSMIVDLDMPPPGATEGSMDLVRSPLVARMPGRALLAAEDGSSTRQQKNAPWVLDTEARTGARIARPDLDVFAGGVLFGQEVVCTGIDPTVWSEPRATTGAGSVLTVLTDIFPGPIGSGPAMFIAFRGGVCFIANDGRLGYEPWITDGTTTGTSVLVDLVPGPASSIGVHGAARVGDEVLFFAESPGSGREPWSTDGTAAGTRMLADLQPGAASSSWEGASFVEWRGKGYFVASTSGGRALFETDGTTAGTIRIASLPAVDFHPLVADEERIYLVGNFAKQLWISDGTAAGTVMVADLSASRYLRFAEVVPGSDGVYIVAFVTGGGQWSLLHGDENGVVHLADSEEQIHGCSSGSRFGWFGTVTDERLEILRSDGTAGGTVQVYGRDWIDGRVLTVSKSVLLFAADDGIKGMEPWSGPAGACVESFGFGCGEGIRAPSLYVSDPVLGDSVRLSLRASRLSAPGLMVLGAPGDGVALPNGCTMYIDNAEVLTLLATDAQGDWQVTVPLLNDPALRGLRFAVMGAVAGAGGFDSTATAVGTFGD